MKSQEHRGKQEIIVKRRKKADEQHHGGAWKVAYADFVTAMMAFFMVMWLINQNPAVRVAVAAYFRDPGVFETNSLASLLEAAGVSQAGAVPGGGNAGASDVPSQQALQSAARGIKEHLESEARVLRGLDKQVEINVTGEGLRIELIESDESTFFDSGSATVHPATERLLGLIASELGRLSKPVIIEGHTDGRPYTPGNPYSNWDLSADRANAARRVMESAGLPPELVASVRGYADRHLRIPKDPLDAHNRRVSIVVPVGTSLRAKP